MSDFNNMQMRLKMLTNQPFGLPVQPQELAKEITCMRRREPLYRWEFIQSLFSVTFHICMWERWVTLFVADAVKKLPNVQCRVSIWEIRHQMKSRLASKCSVCVGLMDCECYLVNPYTDVHDQYTALILAQIQRPLCTLQHCPQVGYTHLYPTSPSTSDTFLPLSNWVPTVALQWPAPAVALRFRKSREGGRGWKEAQATVGCGQRARAYHGTS